MSKKNGDVIGAMSGSQYEYEKQLNARTAVPEHSKIILRWQKLSFLARYSSGGIFDLAYGGHPMEKLDFVQTEKYGGPLLVFIHGGFFAHLTNPILLSLLNLTAASV
jgi:arylformamidase